MYFFKFGKQKQNSHINQENKTNIQVYCLITYWPYIRPSFQHKSVQKLCLGISCALSDPFHGLQCLQNSFSQFGLNIFISIQVIDMRKTFTYNGT